ncbi:TolC family protein [Parvularcula flava]|uniref:TolC family protein n=1 Tax=Aquisalinus luteolus TaxID=1566827 RepID=A0A8J3A9A1_9PROT|nr:TolC family protein [Aquisalinus luteolus]NHK28904.1 TolC family protein [Aquisalinus luteolus]GGH99867.1 hypothetical protein GCM10011355_26840 [Aquisalinus luteolus]
MSVSAQELIEVTAQEVQTDIIGEAPEMCDTLGSAIAAALSYDQRLDVAEATANIAKTEIETAYSNRRPTVTLYTRGGQGTGGFLADNQIDNQVGIRIDQMVYNFGQQGFLEDEVTARYQAERMTQLATRRQVIEQVGGLYLEALRSMMLLEIAREKEIYYARLRDTLDRRLELNAITLTEASNIRANYALAAAEKERLETRIQAVTEIFAEVTGRETACYAERLANVSFLPLAMSLDEVKAIVVNRSAELDRLGYQREAAESSLKRISRERLPQINLSAYRAEQYNDLTDDWEQRDRLGFSITTDLFTGGRNTAQQSRARWEMARSDAQIRSLEQQIRQSVSELWVNYTHRQPNIRALEQAQQSLREQLTYVEREYELGARLLDDAVEVANRYFSTRTNLANTRFSAASDALSLCVQTGCADGDRPIVLFDTTQAVPVDQPAEKGRHGPPM